jgi:hypothetical protein
MQNGRFSYFLIILLILALESCKVLVKTQSNTPNPPAADTILTIDTIPSQNLLITQKGDTLDSLFQEVEISISRLLPDTVKIMAVGDIMMGTKFPNESFLPGGNGEYLWDHTRELLKSADITFGNLEGTMLDGEGEPKKCSNPKVCYLFKMPTRLGANLVDAGFDLLSIANNHANDFGPTGRKSTQNLFDSLNIVAAGAVEKPFTSTKIGHLKVGFVAFAPNTGTLTFYDEQRAVRIVKELDSLNDMVIVSIHGGAEGSKNMHLTKQREFYYGEDRGNIYEFSHKLIDNGADIILGHGPHVVRAIEVYKERIIAYSLGNFLTYGRFNLRGVNGEAPLLEISTDPEGRFIEGQIQSFYQSYNLGPRKDDQNRALRSIKKLSEEDLSENQIKIDDAGRIFYIQR